MVNLPDDVRELYPWTGKRLAVDGGTMHYLDEGPEDAPVLLCLHGNPTWSFYWRSVVDRFAGDFRVVVPDHIGCGLSDKPQDWPYQLDGHIANIERLVEHLGLKRITFVLHDWGGAIGMGVATRHPDLAARFVITNTAAFLSSQIPFSIATCKLPVYGPLAVRGFNGFARVAAWRAPARPLAPAVKHGLLLPYGSWADRIATLRFVQDIPMRPDHPSYGTLRTIDERLALLADRPMLIVWGEKDFCFTPAFREEWERRFPDARAVRIEDAGHYVLEDAPERTLALIDSFLASSAARVA